MAMTLPPSIRPYWSELTAEKATAPAHRAFEWYPDPFEAKKEVEERQTKKKAKDEAVKEAIKNGSAGDASAGGASASNGGKNRNAGGQNAPGGREWADVPEVRMAPLLRESVEGVVRKVCLCLFR